MNSILSEIDKIRNKRPLIVDRTNKNRYRLVAHEEDGTKTAYYFSVPIYSQSNQKLLDLKFQNQGKSCFLTGSNSNIVVGDSVLLRNRQGTCQITMPNGYRVQGDQCIVYQGAEVFPTTNGIAIKADLNIERQYCFRLKTEHAFYQIQQNNKYVALMSEKFTPFVTVSCIGSLYQGGTLFAPAAITCQQINSKELAITVYSNSIYAKQVLFEINLQETKLFQDTTVESKTPTQNNAFGGTAFIGNSSAFGEQWLYSRPNISLLNDLFGESILSAFLYIPTLHRDDMKLMAVGVATRFCSFGSTWNNKKEGSEKTSFSKADSGYYKIDIANMLAKNNRILTNSEGWIIKSAVKNSGFSAISTGDSFYAPQILKITFR